MDIRDWFKPKLLRVRPTWRTRPVAEWRNVSWTSSAVWKRAVFGFDGFEVEFRPRYAPPKNVRVAESLPENVMRDGTLTMRTTNGWIVPLEKEDSHAD